MKKTVVGKKHVFSGKSYFFRTVTYHIIGTVVRECKEIGTGIYCLKDASWVADSGRFMQAIKDGKLSEVEPVGDWYINIQSVTDFGPWNHLLPMEQK